MIWKKRETTWPVLCILASLFVLIVTAPRSWERKPTRNVASYLGAVSEKDHSVEKSRDLAPQTGRSADASPQGPSSEKSGEYNLPKAGAEELPVGGHPTSSEKGVYLRGPGQAILSDPSDRVAGPPNPLYPPEWNPVSPRADLSGGNSPNGSPLPNQQSEEQRIGKTEAAPLLTPVAQAEGFRSEGNALSDSAFREAGLDQSRSENSQASRWKPDQLGLHSPEEGFPPAMPDVRGASEAAPLVPLEEPIPKHTMGTASSEEKSSSGPEEKSLARTASPQWDSVGLEDATLPQTHDHQKTDVPEEPLSGSLQVQSSGAAHSAAKSGNSGAETMPLANSGAENSDGEGIPAEKSDRPVEQEQPAWRPQALVDQLEGIVADPQVGLWAQAVLGEIQRMTATLEQRTPEAGAIVHRLTQLGRESDGLEAGLTDRGTARAFRQVRFALYRRLDLWGHWLEEPREIQDIAPVELSEAEWHQFSKAVEELDRLTAYSAEGRAWRRYLLLDSLKELVVRGRSFSEAERRNLARTILERFTRRGLDPEQQRFLNTGPGVMVQRHLRFWAAEPADNTLQILAHVEAYESTGHPGDAQAVALDCERLLFSAHPARRALGEKLQKHYQNANLRIVMTEDLLNRLIPERDPEYQWVSDTVLGMPVRGRSLMFTEVAVRTISDPKRIRLALEVTGRVSSLTTAIQGPAAFYNRSDAIYVARKPLEVGTFGIRLWPAEVEVVRNSTRLRGLETDFDPIPLLGSIIQEVARSQHEARRWEADREVEAKVAARAKAQIDAEADARLTSVSQGLHEQVLNPMTILGLGPEMVAAKTDSQRITMRIRVGGQDQLGANTPRPWAPSDSLASFQVHETAVNNFLDRLDLAGRTFTLPELRQWVAERIHRPQFAQRKTEHDDVCLTFAERDPVVVRFQDGRFSVWLSLAYLQKGQNEWNHFQVRAFYRPEINGAQAQLVRDGVVHLLGDLDMRSQIGLRGLFGKAFDKEKTLPIAPENLSPDPRMANLIITQFVIEDGWAGIAVGPKQRAAPPEIARLPNSASLGPIY